jgi:NAD(P)-dependent dehydrogenase (short-subunit alcohol dehydrogenase family)
MGREAALTFAREGALVVGCGLFVEEAEATVAAVRAAGGTIVSMQPCDLTKAADCQALVDFAVRTFGGSTCSTVSPSLANFRSADIPGTTSLMDASAFLGTNPGGTTSSLPAIAPNRRQTIICHRLHMGRQAKPEWSVHRSRLRRCFRAPQHLVQRLAIKFLSP